MKYATFPVLAVLLAAAWSANAHEPRAHVHGVAKLQAALDGNTLEIELITPLDNVLGFEHAPRNDKQRKAVQSMVEQFRKPELLFMPTATARCTTGPAQLRSPVTNGDGPAQGGKDDDGHAELEAVITFRCEAPSALKDVDVRLFDAFPQLHRLEVQMVGPNGQSATTLTSKRRRLSW